MKKNTLFLLLFAGMQKTWSPSKLPEDFSWEKYCLAINYDADGKVVCDMVEYAKLGPGISYMCARDDEGYITKKTKTGPFERVTEEEGRAIVLFKQEHEDALKIKTPAVIKQYL